MTCLSKMQDPELHHYEQQRKRQHLAMKKLSGLDPRTSSGSCSMESQDSGVFCDNSDVGGSIDDPTASPCVQTATGRPPSASCHAKRLQFKQQQQSQVSILGPDDVDVLGIIPSEPSKKSVGVNTGPVVYDSGYDNLVIGQFMSLSAGSGGWILNSAATQQPSSEASRAGNIMHLDFLSSPRDISYSLSSASKDFPHDKYSYRQPNFDASPLLSPLADSSQDTLDSILAATSADLFESNLLTSADLLSHNVSEPLSPTAPTFQDRSSRGSWSKYSVLPPLGTSEQPDSNMAPSVQTIPAFAPSLFAESSTCSSSFTSPRNSTRSSYSCRGASKKRALSNSPLSIEGIDFNSLIRMSPTSLAPFPSSITDSHFSPFVGEKQGCYGHLSARNSSSGSTGSSVTRLSLSSICTAQNNLKDLESLGDIDSQLLAYQAMQLLEATNIPVQDNLVMDNHAVLHQDTLQGLDEDLLYKAGLCGGESIGLGHVLPSVQSPEVLAVPVVPNRPPPSYNQHMARKFLLQKKNSSDSSQPSNYSSFDSSEGDRPCDSEESPQPQPLTVGRCQWTDCGQPFSGQDDLVRHLEKSHVDQRKGDEFTCYWQGCSRKLRPFNARYKLLIHMRVHSGEKPNKCTFEGCPKAFSRLENLKIHLRSHTGERPYACQHPSCTKAFSNSSDRAKHQRTHQDTKPYACNVPGCNKRYTDPSSLRKHVKNHSNPKPDVAKKRPRCALTQDAKSDAELSLSDCLTVRPLRPQCVTSFVNTASSNLTSSLGCVIGVRSPSEPFLDSGLGPSPPSQLGSTTSRNTDAEQYIGFPSSNSCASIQTSPLSQDVSSPGLLEIFESDESLLECLPFLPPITSPVARGHHIPESGYTHTESLPSIHSQRSPVVLPPVDRTGTSQGTTSFPSFHDSFPKCPASFQPLSKKSNK